MSRPVRWFGIDRNVELVWVSDARISGGEDVELGGLEGLLAMAEHDGRLKVGGGRRRTATMTDSKSLAVLTRSEKGARRGGDEGA